MSSVAAFQNIKTPYLTILEQGSTPANPDAGNQRLFIKSSDHTLNVVNSVGAVSPVAASVPAAVKIYMAQTFV